MRRTTKKSSVIVTKLAALSQKSFPKIGEYVLTWEPDHLFPAQGRYRTDKNIDCYCWTGHANPISELFVRNVIGR